jgi:hypothetical protein
LLAGVFHHRARSFGQGLRDRQGSLDIPAGEVFSHLATSGQIVCTDIVRRNFQRVSGQQFRDRRMAFRAQSFTA